MTTEYFKSIKPSLTENLDNNESWNETRLRIAYPLLTENEVNELMVLIDSYNDELKKSAIGVFDVVGHGYCLKCGEGVQREYFECYEHEAIECEICGKRIGLGD